MGERQLQSVLVLYVFSRRRDCSDVVPLFLYTDCSCFILIRTDKKTWASFNSNVGKF